MLSGCADLILGRWCLSVARAADIGRVCWRSGSDAEDSKRGDGPPRRPHRCAWSLLFQFACGRPAISKPWIDGFALHRQNAERALMDAAQWLMADESLQRLDAECELANRE